MSLDPPPGASAEAARGGGCRLRFLGASEPGPGAAILLEGRPGEPGPASVAPAALRRASLEVSPWALRRERDLRSVGLADGGDRALDEALAGPAHLRRVFLAADHLEADRAARAVRMEHPGLARIVLDAHLEAPAGERGQTWYLGTRACSREERDLARRSQRLLPLHEVDLLLAARSAAGEIGPDLPVHVTLDLDVLDPAWAPAVDRPVALGATARELWAALEALARLRVVSLALVGLAPARDLDGRTARLGAEVVRDTILAWW